MPIATRLLWRHAVGGVSTWSHELRQIEYSSLSIYTVSQKTGPLFTAYNFRNIEQIFTKFGTNQSLFILNIVPEFI